MPTVAASSDTSVRASQASYLNNLRLARADKDEPRTNPICTRASQQSMHTTARHKGLVQHSVGMRAANLESSSTISDSLGTALNSVSREPFEA